MVYIIDKLENTKKRNKAISEARKKISDSNVKCLICGKVKPTFCDSHSVPYNVFNGMKLDCGMLYSFFEIVDMDAIMNISKGKKNSGIFKNICRDCDNNYFRDLDNLDILKEKWDNKDLRLQEIRILLYQIYRKREHSLMIYDYLKSNFTKNELKKNIRETKKDVTGYKRKLREILKTKRRKYIMLYEECLDFETNFCCVTSMNIHLTLNLWNIVPSNNEKTKFISYIKNNEFYTTVELSEKDKINNVVYLVVLPRNGKTKVIFYAPKGSIVGNILYEEFKDLPEASNKLMPISWFLCVFGNNIYGNEKFLENYKNYKRILQYAQSTKEDKKNFSLNLKDIEKEYKLMEINKFNLFEK